MSTSDVLAVVAATVVTILVVLLATVLVLLTRTLRQLRASVATLEREALEMLTEARVSVNEAATEVDRVERLVTSAERLDEAKRADRDSDGQGDGVRHRCVSCRATSARGRVAPTRAHRPLRPAAGDRLRDVIKRLVWLVIGFLLGLGSSWTVMRRLRRVAVRLAPADVVDRWSDNVRAAVNEGRDAMRAREASFKGSSVRSAGK